MIDFSLTGTVGSRSGQPAAAYWQRFLEIGPALQKIYPVLAAARQHHCPPAWDSRCCLWLVPLAGLVGLEAFLVRRLNTSQPAAARSSRQPLPSTGASTGAPAIRFAGLLSLFIIVYLLVLSVVQVLTYPPITLASRMLSPVHLAVLALLLALLHLSMVIPGAPAAGRSAWRWGLRFAALACVALLGSYALRSALIARDYHRTGIGYTSLAWRNSGAIATLRKLPENVPIISNETTAVMFLAGRPAYPVQEIYQSHPLEKFTAYGEGEDGSQRVFREQDGALVLFYSTLEEDFSMYGDRTGERIQALTRGLSLYAESDDGAIYFLRPAEMRLTPPVSK